MNTSAGTQMATLMVLTDTTPGIYTLRDLRVGISTQEGVDQLSGIEIFRFGEGPELTFAQMLDRAPSAIELLGTPVTSPGVSETAAEGTVVAQLFATDPDPGDIVTFSFAPGGDAGGCLVIDGNLLRVARNDAFDHESATSHAVTVIATDTSGNTVSRTFDVAVEDVFEILTNLSVEVPATADQGSAQLWDLATGGYVLTWQETRPEGAVLIARRVDASGTPLSGPQDDLDLGDPFARQFLGVDAEGRAAFLTIDAARETGSSSSVSDGVERTTGFDIGYDEVTWIDVSSGQQVDSLQMHDAMTSRGMYSPTHYSETDFSVGGGREGIDSTFLGYFDGHVICSVTHISEGSGGFLKSTGQVNNTAETGFPSVTRTSFGASSTTQDVNFHACRAGENPVTLAQSRLTSSSAGSSRFFEETTFFSEGSFNETPRIERLETTFRTSSAEDQSLSALLSAGTRNRPL